MIIITGDSWGVGEWGFDAGSYCLTGPGLAQYLGMHTTVVNLSVGGSSNSNAIRRLDLFLKKYSVSRDDTIYWIVTNPRRCSSPEAIARGDQSIESATESLLLNAFEQAQLLAQTYNTNIELIGGLCDLGSVDVASFKNLTVTVPSWGKIIDENYFSSMYCYDNDWHKIGSLIATGVKKQEWLNLSLECEKKQTCMNELFSSDQHHPSRFGHRQLRDFLYPQWKHKF